MGWIAKGNKKAITDLKQQSGNITESIQELKQILSDYHNIERKDRKSRLSVISSRHSKNLEIYNKVSKELNENHSARNSSLRKISYLLERNSYIINNIGQDLAVFGVERIENNIHGLLESFIEIQKDSLELINGSRTKNASEKIQESLSEAQSLLNDSLADLFHYHKNPIDLIKYLEIYRLFSKFVENASQASLEIQLT